MELDTAQTVYRYDVQPNTASLTTTITNEPAGSASYDSALESYFKHLEAINI